MLDARLPHRLSISPATPRARLIVAARMVLAALMGYIAGTALERARQTPWGDLDSPCGRR